MKKIILLSLLAGALVCSCSKDEHNKGELENPSDLTSKAFVNIKVATPSPSTRANAEGDEVPGTAEESKVTNVLLLAFDQHYNFISSSQKSAVAVTNGYECKFSVAPDAYRFFAIANPIDAVTNALTNLSGNWNTVSQKLQTIITPTISDVASDNNFLMVNAGEFDGTTETVLVSATAKLSTDENVPTPITIPVDRIVTKLVAGVSSSLVVKGEMSDLATGAKDPYATIDGMLLNVTNKKSYIYSHINQVNDRGNDYREDPNMAVDPANIDDNFNWLHNYNSPTFGVVRDPIANTYNTYTEYALENTAKGTRFDYNNLTQLMVEATYTPTGKKDASVEAAGFDAVLNLKDGDSWFAINLANYGTMQFTFTGVKKYYNAITATYTPPAIDYSDPTTAAHMDTQLRHMLTKCPAGKLNSLNPATATWADANLTLDVLDAIPNGGYVAATVALEEDYIVQYYQHSKNYYDIFIQHDSDQEIGHLGRWGMVKNNQYELTINSITGPGYPYIPDPTDENIKDPQNPDPTNPDPADEKSAHIQATISVNPWTIWTQGVDLN